MRTVFPLQADAPTFDARSITADVAPAHAPARRVERAHRLIARVLLGGLALQDVSSKSLKKAEKFVKKTLAKTPGLAAGAGRSFYAVGGTWRALGRLHMWQTGYPLHVMHG